MILYVGMDVHKESISIACTAESEDIRHYEATPNYFAVLDSVIRKLVGSGHIPLFVYDAGPGG
jgi:hypothetical protein